MNRETVNRNLTYQSVIDYPAPIFEVVTAPPVNVTPNVGMISFERKGFPLSLDIIGKALLALAEFNVPLLMLTQSSCEGNFCLIIPEDCLGPMTNRLMCLFESQLKRQQITSIKAQRNLVMLSSDDSLHDDLAVQGINILALTRSCAGTLSALITTEDACGGNYL